VPPPSTLTRLIVRQYFIALWTLCCSCRWGETVSELRPPTGMLLIPKVICVEPRRNGSDRRNRRTRIKSLSIATLSTYPIWTDPVVYPDLRSERPAINPRSHGSAHEHLLKQGQVTRIPVFYCICKWYMGCLSVGVLRMLRTYCAPTTHSKESLQISRPSVVG
jgi:hypothetical protein